MTQLNPEDCPIPHRFSPHQPEEDPKLYEPRHGMGAVEKSGNLLHLLYQR